MIAFSMYLVTTRRQGNGWNGIVVNYSSEIKILEVFLIVQMDVAGWLLKKKENILLSVYSRLKKQS